MKSNYIVLETYHERYYFSTETTFYKDKTIEEILLDQGYDINEVELVNRTDGFYIIDTTHRRTLSDTELNYNEISGVDGIEPECLIILDLNKINEQNDFNEFIWGHTENKFGLLDIKRKED